MKSFELPIIVQFIVTMKDLALDPYRNAMESFQRLFYICSLIPLTLLKIFFVFLQALAAVWNSEPFIFLQEDIFMGK